MSNVFYFKKPDEEESHGSGEAFCIQCAAKWIAVAPIGTLQLECPECHTMKGLFKFSFNLPEGQFGRECNCGSQLFYLTPEGHMCPNCGTYQMYD